MLESPGSLPLHAAALGSTSSAATWAWMAAVNTYAHEPHSQAVASWVWTATELDPSWSPPLTYGALMLAAQGDVAGHQALLRRGLRAHPDDPWFPTALAMSRLLDSNDRADAARWLAFASSLPGADPIWRDAAMRLEAP